MAESGEPRPAIAPRPVTVAAVHAAPVWLDADATADKAVSLIAEAARAGAQAAVFPESFLPGFPAWAGLAPPIRTHEFFRAFAAASVRVDGPQVARIRQAARRHGLLVSLGISESTDASVGCLWNSNLLIGPDGALLNHHRKLVPTYWEKLVWAPGDGAGLRVSQTALGRVGMLICGENTNPLARYALMAQGEELHFASFPAIWPTRPPGETHAYDIEEAIRVRCAAHAFEAKCFVVVASNVLDEAASRHLATLGAEAEHVISGTPRAVSLVIGPDGRQIGQSQRDEGILTVTVDLGDCVEPKQFHDVVGYYQRPDVFQLQVNRTALQPAVFGQAAPRPSPPDPDWQDVA